MPVAAELEKLRALHRQAREQRESIWRAAACWRMHCWPCATRTRRWT